VKGGFSETTLGESKAVYKGCRVSRMFISVLCLKATKDVAKPGTRMGQVLVILPGYNCAQDSAQEDPKGSVGRPSVFPLLEKLMREVYSIHRLV
jgi:hypothetical protein